MANYNLFLYPEFPSSIDTDIFRNIAIDLTLEEEFHGSKTGIFNVTIENVLGINVVGRPLFKHSLIIDQNLEIECVGIKSVVSNDYEDMISSVVDLNVVGIKNTDVSIIIENILEDLAVTSGLKNINASLVIDNDLLISSPINVKNINGRLVILNLLAIEQSGTVTYLYVVRRLKGKLIKNKQLQGIVRIEKLK